MRYHNYFRMQDFFCNDQLVGIVPQFDKRDLMRNEVSDETIYIQCRNVINGFLNGKVTSNGIEVRDMPIKSVMRIVTSCKYVLEAMFDNADSIIRNVRNNKRVYTTVETFSQIVDFDADKKLEFLNDILDNINYNPEFNSQNSVHSYSAMPYKERQRAWARRVGYKLKEVL